MREKTVCHFLDAAANVAELEQQQLGVAYQLLVRLLASGLKKKTAVPTNNKGTIVKKKPQQQANLGFHEKEETLEEFVGDRLHGN